MTLRVSLFVGDDGGGGGRRLADLGGYLCRGIGDGVDGGLGAGVVCGVGTC